MPLRGAIYKMERRKAILYWFFCYEKFLRRQEISFVSPIYWIPDLRYAPSGMSQAETFRLAAPLRSRSSLSRSFSEA
jgi:hypothetical protein